MITSLTSFGEGTGIITKDMKKVGKRQIFMLRNLILRWNVVARSLVGLKTQTFFVCVLRFFSNPIFEDHTQLDAVYRMAQWKILSYVGFEDET